MIEKIRKTRDRANGDWRPPLVRAGLMPIARQLQRRGPPLIMQFR